LNPLTQHIPVHHVLKNRLVRSKFIIISRSHRTTDLTRTTTDLPLFPQQATNQALRPRANPFLSSRFVSLHQQTTRLLSNEVRTAIDKAVATAPIVLFMKGTPEMPQCGFSRASIQILGLQGVNPEKFTAFNVLEDPELRQGKELGFSLPELYFIAGRGGRRRWMKASWDE
jgi:monothiol glutaredoxin